MITLKRKRAIPPYGIGGSASRRRLDPNAIRRFAQRERLSHQGLTQAIGERRLMQEAAVSGELFVATHLPFPSVGRVKVDGEAFRWVAVFWDD